MAWGYSQSNGLFGGYEPQSYSEEADSRSGAGTMRASSSEGTRFGTGPNDWTWANGSPSDQKRWAQNKANAVGSRGGGGGGGSSTRTTSQTSRLRFTEPMPELPDLGKLELAKVDPRKVRALTQKAAAPNIRALREQMQVAANIKSDNPNVRRMTLREALQGYGTGLERAMSGAGAQARAEHGQELNIQNQEAQANYNTMVQSRMQAYNNAFNRYMQSAERITEGSSTTGESGGSPMVVRRNVWGTPYLGPDSNVSRRTGESTNY